MTLNKLLETYQARINDLQYQITTNPVELQKLITLEKTIQRKLN
jgi:CHASE3 domain sensor protein